MRAFSAVPDEAAFLSSPPSLEQLLSKYAALKGRLNGKFSASPIDDSTSGPRAISWEFERGDSVNPRLTRISPGRYSFENLNHRAIIVLEGRDDCIETEGISVSKNQCLPLPYGTEVEMQVNGLVLIWEQFRPVNEMGIARIVTVTSQALDDMRRQGEDFHDLIVSTLHHELDHPRGDYLTYQLFDGVNPDSLILELEKVNRNSPLVILAISDPSQILELQCLCQFAGVRYNLKNITIE